MNPATPQTLVIIPEVEELWGSALHRTLGKQDSFNRNPALEVTLEQPRPAASHRRRSTAEGARSPPVPDGCTLQTSEVGPYALYRP